MSDDSDISLLQLVRPVWRRWRLVLAVACAFAIAAGIFLLLQRPVYTARVTFTPETPSGPDVAGLVGLAGLAGQLGLGGGSSVSPDFFAAVVHSRELLRTTLETAFPDPDSANAQRPLLDIMEVPGDSPAERLQKGTTVLDSRTRAIVDRRTSIVRVDVEMHSPALAAQVANRLVALLNEFNLERRQTQSRAQRKFTGDRLEQARGELREAEQAHLSFLQRNRTFEDSPLLSFEANRLAREVLQKQELVLTLTKAHEEARIAEVRDTPVLTVIDPAIPPILRTRPRRTLGVVVAGILGLLAGAAAAYVMEYRALRSSAFGQAGVRPPVRERVPDSVTASHS